MSIPFSVRETSKKERSKWQLDLKAAFFGQRRRLFFQSEHEAWAEGMRMADLLRERGQVGVREDRGGVSVSSAMRLFLAEAQDKSGSHRQKCEMFAKRFEARFTGPVAGVDALVLMRWLKDLGGSPTTQAMWHRYARLFFRWAKANRMVKENPLEGARMPRATPRRKILTPAQMRGLLKAEMHDAVRALVLLGGFAGLRTIEVARMYWEDVDFKSGQVHVRAEVAKQTDGMLERIVDMTEPLKRRKDFFKGRTGPIIAGAKGVPMSLELLHRLRRGVAAGLGWEEWPENALRHSFATYHLGRCGNAGLTAYQMGHTSPTMVQRVYAVPAKRADWKLWWKL